MKKTILLIMAAGLGSRFGTGIKQLEPVGMHEEIIMDYSIHDAIEAGFHKIIIVIRKDIEADFKERIGDRIEKVCAEQNVEIVYAYQSMENIPGEVPAGRSKPWGTGQAVLSAKEEIDSPFAVINADDYYGKEAFQSIHEYLIHNTDMTSYCMAGFILQNTLSEHGGVTRGVCRVDENNMLTDIVETRNIVKIGSGAEADGVSVDPESYVSMNMWGLTTGFVELLEKGFCDFFQDKVSSDPLKAEYILPVYIGELLKKEQISVKVLETQDKWFGVTYQEDKPFVVESIRKLIDAGVYQERLYADLF